MKISIMLVMGVAAMFTGCGSSDSGGGSGGTASAAKPKAFVTTGNETSPETVVALINQGAFTKISSGMWVTTTSTDTQTHDKMVCTGKKSDKIHHCKSGCKFCLYAYGDHRRSLYR